MIITTLINRCTCRYLPTPWLLRVLGTLVGDVRSIKENLHFLEAGATIRIRFQPPALLRTEAEA